MSIETTRSNKTANGESGENTHGWDRVMSLSTRDHHGIRPGSRGIEGDWCGHCHRSYDAARSCSIKRWPDQIEPRSPDRSGDLRIAGGPR